MEAVEDDGLRELKQLARLALVGSHANPANTPTPEEIRSLAETIQHFDLHLNELEMR